MLFGQAARSFDVPGTVVFGWSHERTIEVKVAKILEADEPIGPVEPVSRNTEATPHPTQILTLYLM